MFQTRAMTNPTPRTGSEGAAWVQLKSREKCSLIVKVVPMNQQCVLGLSFQLHMLEHPAMRMELAALKKRQLYFAKLDISRMFWSGHM